MLTHINFNHVNKIEAGYKVLSLNEKFYAYERPFMYCRDFICERKFYARTQEKLRNTGNQPWKLARDLRVKTV